MNKLYQYDWPDGSVHSEPFRPETTAPNFEETEEQFQFRVARLHARIDSAQIAAMIEPSQITSNWRTRMDQCTVSNEEAYTILEHAIDYLSTLGYPDDSVLAAVQTLREAHKAIGPLGQIPSWETV